ncbi:hypothetical protein KDW37_31270 [Burkholderia cenocepacia]|uniref:hypothetical protein n=1 Tax=Burkholderia cenocepacia TaxID=95486 RepID=UPI001BA2E3BD|nr:hypothetical protein [Burkholderia cenocepacia]MBR8435241.1 hypothetical protein [Burkholderia cenocepacia]
MTDALTRQIHLLHCERGMAQAELELAHQIILNALQLMTTEQQVAWARLNEENARSDKGGTRYHERAALIARLAKPIE